MVQSYGHGDNKWLQTVYRDRKSWALVYQKEVLLAVLLLTSPFEEYLSQCASLKQFLSSYDRALLELDRRETIADAESRKFNGVALKSTFYFEVQLSKLYTNGVYKKFQDEVQGMCACFSLSEISTNRSLMTYMVKEDVLIDENWRETRDFEVTYNALDAEVICTCGLFNFKGCFCRQALCVLNQTGVDEIPPQYILSRWGVDKGIYTFNHVCDVIDINNPVHRYNNLYKCILKVVEEGSKSEEHYKIASRSLDQMLNKVRIQED